MRKAEAGWGRGWTSWGRGLMALLGLPKRAIKPRPQPALSSSKNFNTSL